MVFAAMDIIIVKADRRLKLGEVWFAELRESLVVTKRATGHRFNSERLPIRYFKAVDDGGLRYKFEQDAHVYYNQIYGTVGCTSHRSFGGLPAKLIAFRISDEEFQAARQLVSGAAGTPPIVLEFNEAAGDDESDDKSDGDEEAPRKRQRRS